MAPPTRPTKQSPTTKDAAQPAAPQSEADEARRQVSSEGQATDEAVQQVDINAKDEQARRDAEEAAQGEQERQEAARRAAEGDGPEVIEGTVDTGAKFRVEVKTNFAVARETYKVGQKVEVPDNPETRAGIDVGFLRILDDDEQLDDETAPAIRSEKDDDPYGDEPPV